MPRPATAHQRATLEPIEVEAAAKAEGLDMTAWARPILLRAAKAAAEMTRAKR